ncbi:unnamed protein product [Polarella glacialis]|uniref:Uncharacterized protein n=1 Tax=Polarella glacialis TaxID=89957 RepID=A0A813KR88_POLGL|nr:unnamed protein product [Polarella glacialis]
MHGTGCTLVLPGSLLAVSAVVCVYRQMTEDANDIPLTGFLASILMSMLPLVALKAKIWSCNDRVSLVPMVLVKTLLMHAALEVLRILSQFSEGWQSMVFNRMNLGFDCAMLAAALAALRYSFGLPWSLSYVLDHRDVRNLILMAIAAAFVSEVFFVFVMPINESVTKQGLSVSKVLFAAANYVDVVGFMPVVWRLYQAENALDDFSVGTVVSLEARQQVRVFFAFVCTFYLWDDVLEPISSSLDEQLAMMAHIAHFMLLIDFAGFFLFQVGSPATLKEQGRKGNELERQGLLDDDGEDDV